MLMPLIVWDNRHFAPEGASVVIADSETGDQVNTIWLISRRGFRLRNRGLDWLRGLLMMNERDDGSIFRV